MTDYYVWTFLFILMIAEVFFPRNKQSFIRKGFFVDFFYMVLFYSISAFLYRPFNIALAWIENYSVICLENYLPGIIEFILCLVILDFVNYTVHRLMHESDRLWHIHKLHHSTEELSSLSAYRAGHFEDFFLILGSMIVALVLGFKSEYVAICAIIFRLHGYISHSNFPIRFPKLLSFIVSPNYHAAHHKRDPRFLRSNYGLTFTFWDKIFGTYNFPDDIKIEDFGLIEKEGEEFDKKNPIVKYFYFPFWRKY
jgi:sterol desaturase/sphingolipid hydroxylase (fatty acid hydroxylase superfamily)